MVAQVWVGPSGGGLAYEVCEAGELGSSRTEVEELTMAETKVGWLVPSAVT